ncbi:MAG: hypothetical protein PHO46_10290 [Thermoguttaceae bacterium]|jgi:hypothetical protein|nr:hypothetical protein [Thermoguttaceae bacterium]
MKTTEELLADINAVDYWNVHAAAEKVYALLCDKEYDPGRIWLWRRISGFDVYGIALLSETDDDDWRNLPDNDACASVEAVLNLLVEDMSVDASQITLQTKETDSEKYSQLIYQMKIALMFLFGQ